MWQRGERLRALLHLGAWDELEHEADTVLRWDEAHGRGQLGIFPRMYLAQVLTHRGSMDEAAVLASASLDRALESGDEQVFVPSVAAAMLVAFARGEGVKALEHLRDLETWTGKTLTRTWRSFCLAWPVRIATALGEIDVAAAFLDGSPESFAWDECARPAALASIAEARGERTEAASLYQEAAERWAAYGSVVEQGYALLALGRCGDADATGRAEAIFARLGAHPVTGAGGILAQQQV